MRGAIANLGVLCVSACALLAGGCDREQTPAPPAEAPAETVLTEPAETPEEYVLVRTIDTGIEALKGIALDAENNLYTAGEAGIRMSSPEGALIRELRTSGPATCVAVDADGNVYAGQRTRIETFDPEGNLLCAWGRQGRGPGELDYVTSIAVFEANVLVADAGSRCVHRFDVTGDFIGDIGKRDSGAGLVGLVCPSPYLDLAVDAGGVVHVTNPGLTRVERYSLDGSLLGSGGEGGTQPEEFAGCCNPTNLALRADGAMVTAEKEIPRVKVYDRNGAMLAFLGPHHFTKAAAGLDLAVDSAGRLLIMDPGDGAIHVFERRQ